VLEHGLADVSLRPLATAIGSSPRVLLYLFDSKDALVRALLARARVDELELLDRLRGPTATELRIGLPAVATEVCRWLAAPEHRALLTLWAEAYARSLAIRSTDERGARRTQRRPCSPSRCSSRSPCDRRSSTHDCGRPPSAE